MQISTESAAAENPAYMADRFAPRRRRTVPVRVGNRVIGGDAPILVQSMTTTSTKDVDATVFQTLELWRAGCELVRITAPTQKDAEMLRDIVKKVRDAGCDLPISADIHFQPRAAYEAVKWVEKVRVNPGNFVDSKAAVQRVYDDASFAGGAQRVYDAFAPLVRQARERGAALRIGTNHGSLSDRMMWKFGDTVEGMVESALEYLAVCEAEHFDQVVFSMKSSNPRVAIQAYRLLAQRLDQGHKPYPFHVGVTEAGDGEDGRLKSSVGIGALLLDGIGDTIRVSLTEDPVQEIPVAKTLVRLCDPARYPAVPAWPEQVGFYAYHRRETPALALGPLTAGGREPVAVGIEHPGSEAVAAGERKPEWVTYGEGQTPYAGVAGAWQPAVFRAEDGAESAWIVLGSGETDALRLAGKPVEIRVDALADLSAWEKLPAEKFPVPTLWSCDPGMPNLVGAYRHLVAWLARQRRDDLLVLRDRTDGTPEGNMGVAVRLGALLADGWGDLIHIDSGAGKRAAMNLAFDVLQAAGVRRSKPEYVACPGCGRTLFDLQSTTQRIRQKTAHLKNIAIAVMGCIVNGPGEMADADFGYVGGAPGKVSLYVGRECVQKNIPEAEAPEALVALIRAHGRWIDPV